MPTPPIGESEGRIFSVHAEILALQHGFECQDGKELDLSV
jgi:hypothetical protein